MACQERREKGRCGSTKKNVLLGAQFAGLTVKNHSQLSNLYYLFIYAVITIRGRLIIIRDRRRNPTKFLQYVPNGYGMRRTFTKRKDTGIEEDPNEINSFKIQQY